MFTYATCGMARGREAGEEHGVEIFMLSPSPDSQIVEVLAAVAQYHVAGRPLGLHHTVNFGTPWLSGGSACTFGFLSRPYLDGAEFEWSHSGVPPIRFLWLIPITEAERDFKVAHGADELERRFEEHSFDYLDPWRPSVA